MINENLNNLFAKCQQLPDEDLKTLLNEILTEHNNRQDRDRKEAWAKVREAIMHYTANYGNIRVTDLYSDIMLCHGQFTFSEYGDIEVGA